MSYNKLALIRYKTIDRCLSNRARKWTLEDLIDKVSDALYEFEGVRDGVSRRTVQLDIQTMRSDKLGYNAPIIVVDRKYYTYEDPHFTITRSNLTASDIDTMNEVVGLLKQLNGFSHFGEMSEIIARLETSVSKNRDQERQYIQFESNPLLRGLQHINPILQAIRQQQAILLEYQSFRARAPVQGVYFPYLLKEYRNRWFLLARNKLKRGLITLALDRIEQIQLLPNETFHPYPNVDFDHYFDNAIGVTKSENDRDVRVVLWFDEGTAPYILTKPLHHTQEVLRKSSDGLIVQIRVVLNFELEREILGFGETVKVLSPRLLVKRIKNRMEKAAGVYLDANIPAQD